jgi:hypothetical protein
MCVIETSTAGREYKVRDMAQADFGCVARATRSTRDRDARDAMRCAMAAASDRDATARAMGPRASARAKTNAIK